MRGCRETINFPESWFYVAFAAIESEILFESKNILYTRIPLEMAIKLNEKDVLSYLVTSITYEIGIL